MPMKELKTDTQNHLIIERLLHSRHYSLTLNKQLCKGCEICKTICPREAILIKKPLKKDGEKAKPPILDIDEQRCSYCGMCEPICPFNALQIKINEEHTVPVLKTESFPQLVREITVDTSKCPIKCVDCEKACPLNLIKVNLLTKDGKPVKDKKSIKRKKNLRVQVDIKRDLCPCCRLCEIKCPEGAIHVRKIFHGILNINVQKCPEGCRDCLDVCPIPEALYLEKSDNRVYPKDAYCVFCGVCRLVCPAEGALTLERRSIHHTPIKSGAWNKTLEKLTSVREYSKEAKLKGWMKAQATAEKRLVLKAEGGA